MNHRRLVASPHSTRKMPRVLLVSTAFALAACGGGGGNGSPSPAPPSPSPGSTVCGSAFLGNATAQFSPDNCSSNGCANTGAPNAIDNNRDTAAVMTYAGTGGTMRLIARTQSGTVVPAGRMAGALISLGSQTAVSTTLSFTTYLDNAVQETGGRTTNTASPSTSTTPSFQRFANTKPYNRIDVVVEQSGNVTTRVFEMCSE